MPSSTSSAVGAVFEGLQRGDMAHVHVAVGETAPRNNAGVRWPDHGHQQQDDQHDRNDSDACRDREVEQRGVAPFSHG
jgi:hypothetical protein